MTRRQGRDDPAGRLYRDFAVGTTIVRWVAFIDRIGITPSQEVVELARKTLIQIKHQQEIHALRGGVPWDGDFEAMRTSDAELY